MTPDDKFKLQIVLDKFNRHIEPQVNSYLDRCNFHRARLTQDESVDEFISRCRVLAAKCKFTEKLEINTCLIEQLIIGRRNVTVQEKLTRKLGRCLGHFPQVRSREGARRPAAGNISHAEVVHDIRARKPNQQDDISCTRWGLDHGDTGKCPAHGDIRGKCCRPNHWARLCKTKRSGRSGTPHRQRGRSMFSSHPKSDQKTHVALQEITGKSNGNRPPIENEWHILRVVTVLAI